MVAVFFGATLVRSAFGFGEALVAVPLLALLIPVKVAAPVAVLLSITVAAVVIAQDWRDIELKSATRLVLWTLLGLPLGLVLLSIAPEPVVKALLGVVVAGFSISMLRHGHAYRLDDDRLAWMFGVLAGVLGGAYGMNGPPLAMFGALRRWSPGQFRATLQGYFLPASVLGLTGYWMAGLWTPTVTRYYLLALPTALVAIALGRAINRRVDRTRFLVYIHAGLIASGTVLVVQALLHRR